MVKPHLQIHERNNKGLEKKSRTHVDQCNVHTFTPLSPSYKSKGDSQTPLRQIPCLVLVRDVPYLAEDEWREVDAGSEDINQSIPADESGS